MIECINHSNFDQTLPSDGGLSKQLVVAKDEDVVHHKLPGGKRKRSVVHDLMIAVNSGKQPAKKH